MVDGLDQSCSCSCRKYIDVTVHCLHMAYYLWQTIGCVRSFPNSAHFFFIHLGFCKMLHALIRLLYMYGLILLAQWYRTAKHICSVSVSCYLFILFIIYLQGHGCYQFTWHTDGSQTAKCSCSPPIDWVLDSLQTLGSGSHNRYCLQQSLTNLFKRDLLSFNEKPSCVIGLWKDCLAC